VSAADHHGAALFAMGILAALVRRARTGQGCRVDVSLLSSAIDLQLESFTCYLNGERPASVRQPRHIAGWHFGAPYGVYRTADAHIALSLSAMTAVSKALDLPALAGIGDAEAYERREELADQIAARLLERPAAEWIERFTSHGVWHARVNDYADVVDDPQVRHNNSFMTVTGANGAPVTLVRHPVQYDGAAPDVSLPPQSLGAQTHEIMKEIGYGDAEIDDLAKRGVIGLPQQEAHGKPLGAA
jgi:crotonobetainyl-CoA:carnitine CoA-transferase CaiB-like acyl-CoA transferase